MHISAVVRSAYLDASCERSRAMPFGFGRSALGFWVASLLGFASYGYVVAGIAMSGLEDGPGRLGEATATALVLGLAGALLLGAPAALLFGSVMGRVRGTGWAAALTTGALLSGAVYLAFHAFAAAIVSDWGYVRQPAIFVVASAGAMMVGAVSGTLVGRSGRRELALARRAR
jgi:hypothetical protein